MITVSTYFKLIFQIKMITVSTYFKLIFEIKTTTASSRFYFKQVHILNKYTF